MNRLEKLKNETANECANEGWEYFINKPLKNEPAIIYEYGAHYGFIEGFNSASAEYEKIIAEIEGALEWYAKRDEVLGFKITSSFAIQALQKLKEFRND